MSLSGKLCLQDLLLGEPLEFLAYYLNNSKPLFPFPYVYIWPSSCDSCVSLEWNDHPLRGCHDPILITAVLDVIPLLLQARDREKCVHAILVDPRA